MAKYRRPYQRVRKPRFSTDEDDKHGVQTSNVWLLPGVFISGGAKPPLFVCLSVFPASAGSPTPNLCHQRPARIRTRDSSYPLIWRRHVRIYTAAEQHASLQGFQLLQSRGSRQSVLYQVKKSVKLPHSGSMRHVYMFSCSDVIRLRG